MSKLAKRKCKNRVYVQDVFSKDNCRIEFGQQEPNGARLLFVNGHIVIDVEDALNLATFIIRKTKEFKS